MATLGKDASTATPFRRLQSTAEHRYRYIGEGDFGGKALGLAFMDELLRDRFDPSEFPGINVAIPKLVVLRSSMFRNFIQFNNLTELLNDPPSDDRIGRAFQRATFPGTFTGDLMSLAESLRGPLAVRSSSRLEDAMFQPFAGVYATKMIPNNQSDTTARFHKLIEAIKFVWASTWFREARLYMEKAGVNPLEEEMAVIIQEVAGVKHGERFYPTMSGVGRSFNYYAFGRARPEQGVIDLALGLGKHIVDGGLVWTYCPAYPKLPPPVASPRDLLKTTQSRFWSVNLGDIPTFDPLREAEYLLKNEVEAAEKDGELNHIASTYDGQADRILPGITNPGPRVIDFGPILQYNVFPLNKLITHLLKLCEEELKQDVEIEFAIQLPEKSSDTVEFSFLQVRPMVAFEEKVSIHEADFSNADLLISSDRVLGNGIARNVEDVVYVKPDTFTAAKTPQIAQEIDKINLSLMRDKRPCLLIGFGRWGSSDSWLGIPVVWSQISSASNIVEVTTPEMNVDLSQGSHFFHNLSSFQVNYFAVSHDSPNVVDFDWLNTREVVQETDFVRHVRLKKPLCIKVDGRSARGVIIHG
ncbi:PEP/pyruvate-binding domain-containing protein [bacterium]|nr:PEP/pyruvate-binding domain-containing protein [bacterium]